VEISRQEIIRVVLPRRSRTKFVNTYTNVFVHKVYDFLRKSELKVTDRMKNFHSSGIKDMH